MAGGPEASRRHWATAPPRSPEERASPRSEHQLKESALTVLDERTTTRVRSLALEITGQCQNTCASHCYAQSGPHRGHGSMTRLPKYPQHPESR